MTKRVLAIAVLGVAVVALVACGGSSGGGDEASIRGVMNKELDAIHKSDMHALWNILSPQARSACPWNGLIGAAMQSAVDEALAGTDASTITYANIAIDVKGATATASYQTKSGSDVIDDSSTEDFHKVSGGWYSSDPDGCGGSGATASPTAARTATPRAVATADTQAGTATRIAAATATARAGTSTQVAAGTSAATTATARARSANGGGSYSGQHGLWVTSNCSFSSWTSFSPTLSSDGSTLTGVLSGRETVTFTKPALTTPDPIVGDWNVTYGAPAVVTMSLSNGVYTETAKTPVRVTGSSCDLPPGTVIATFSPTTAPATSAH